MSEKRAYYAIIPANVRYDKDLTPTAKLLYGEISSLCNEKGYCWASNSYFAELYNVSIRTVRMWISQLSEKEYIFTKVFYRDGSKEVESRCISIVKNAIDYLDTSVKNNSQPEEKNFPTLGKKISPPEEKNFRDYIYNNIDKYKSMGIIKYNNNNTAESSADATADGEEKAEVPVLYLPLIGNLQFPIFAKDIEDWQPAYPAIDVLQELYRMRSWFDANPKNKKTELGIKRFIVNWLGRSQDRVPRTQPNANQSPPNNQTKENKTAQMLHASYDMMQEWAESMECNDDSE